MISNWFADKRNTRKPEDPAPAPVRAERVGSGVYLLPENMQVAGRILVDAVPPAKARTWGDMPRIPGAPVEQEPPRYGWVRGILPSPHPDDCYIVAFLQARRFRVVGYIDRYGRAFQASEATEVPPAKYPAVAFARFEQQDEQGRELGTVELYSRSGQITYPARYSCAGGYYTLYGSWFNFSVTGQTLCLDDALARAYLAFYYRPQLFSLGVPYRDLSIVDQTLSKGNPFEKLLTVVKIMETAEQDPAQTPPGLGRCLAHWLQEAGVAELQALLDGRKNAEGTLVQSTSLSKMYALIAGENCEIPDRLVWKLEGALNRYRLVGDLLGERLLDAEPRECRLQVQNLFVDVIDQAPDVQKPLDATWDHPALEWDVRAGVARGMETLRMPLRCEVEFRLDLEAGVVFFDLTVPDADMMPQMIWRDDLAGAAITRTHVFTSQGRDLSSSSGWVARSPEEREKDARDYALRLGLLMAAIAFRQTGQLARASVRARFFSENRDNEPGALVYQSTVNRNVLSAVDSWLNMAKKNPAALYGTAREWEQDSPFEDYSPEQWVQSPADLMEALLASIDAADVGKKQWKIFSPSSSEALGAADESGIAINYNDAQFDIGENMAACLAAEPNEEQGFKIVRTVQDRSNDPQIFEACNRVMAKVVKGDLSFSDQNAVVQEFVGTNQFDEANAQAIQLRVGALTAANNGKHDAEAFERAMAQSRQSLECVIQEAERAGVFQDGDTRIYRVFDSSTSRVIYNALRNGMLSVPGIDLSSERGKRVELAPDGYYQCCLGLLSLLDRSFGHHDDALKYGRECLRLAPTVVNGYRQQARAYMLAGDLPSARSTLLTALHLAVVPEEIAVLYYQLAYVEWKSGRVRPAVACYLKCIANSETVRDQASNELRTLVAEEHQPLMSAEEVNPTLVDAGIPLAPNEEVMALLRRASRAAVNEGLIPAAKNMLTIQLTHHHDNVLAHVLRSLG